ncbi:nitrate- and nitrite sensing domain-containing protein [Streptomyces sp. NPDC021020]|uniref:sensor histidine kinase n=1 Tax=Streptomyces sp. NPDC021020 TaxID=3365109 RepID=UPI0037B63B38
MPGSRDRLTRHRSAPRRSSRFSFALPLVVPAVCLCGLWGYVATGLVDGHSQFSSEADSASAVARPAQTVLARLQAERRFTAIWQAGHTDAARKDLDDARNRTDAAVQDYRRSSPSALDSATRGPAKALDDALVFLPERRNSIDGKTLSTTDAFQYFTTTVSDGISLLNASLRSDDGEFARGAAPTASVAQIAEMLAREDALLSAAAPTGKLDAATRQQFTDALAVQRALRAGMNAGDLPAGTAASWSRITESASFTSLTQIEDAVAAAQGSALPGSASAWPTAATTVSGNLQTLTTDALSDLSDAASHRADNALLGLLLGSLATLAALAGGAYLSLRDRRMLARRLAVLQTHADELSRQWLPRLMARIEAGERIDPTAMQPPQGPAASEEVAKLAASIDRLGRVAADHMLRQSLGREGGEKVFGQLIRRTQSLIHRLISLLDDLERKHEDSDLLKDIFAVDHLATRVRRHAESLVILSGSPPNRRMATPVSIIDVLRSAVAETEQYTRVRVKNLPAERPMALAGRAVADVTHLLAELIENGTAFSPPDTQVSVSATQVAKGLVVHIEDHGLGMPQDVIDHANALLAHPPKLDMRALSEDPRLGHFVVARLAERHSIKVELRDSVYGGTMVVVLLPSALLEELDSPVLDQLKSAASKSGMMAMDAGRRESPTPAVGTAGAPDPAAARDLVTSGAPDDGMPLTHTRIPDHSGFPEYGGAGLLPATSEFPAPGISAGTPATGPAATGWVAPEEHPAHRQSAGQEHPSQPYRPEPVRPEPQPQPQPMPQQRPDTIRGTAVRNDAPGYPAGAPRGGQHAAPPMATPAGAASAGRGAGLSPSTGPVPPPPVRPAGAPAAPGAPSDPHRHLTTPPVLPHRTRGASLAQQLRREATEMEGGGSVGGNGAAGGQRSGDGQPGGISPEASARAMIAIQQGLQRARTPEASEPGGANRPPEDSWRSGGNQWDSGAGQWEGDFND